MSSILAIGGVVVRELYRRKDFYVLFVLTALLTLLLGGIQFFNDPGIVRHVKDLCLFLIWISALLIALTTAARQIPAERESRTIFPLLAKPVSRHQVLLGKFAGCWAASGIALLVFYLFFFLLSAFRGAGNPVDLAVQALLFHWIFLGLVIGMALLGSLVFSAVSANVTVCLILVFGLLLLGPHLGKLAEGMAEPGKTVAWTLYFLLPHVEFFDLRNRLVHQHGSVEWWFWSQAALYGLIYTGVFLAASCWIFRRKALD